jgi:hypothetical protein
MLDGTNATNERPDIEESYISAAGTSTMKVEPHKRTPADLIIAAGMSTHRMGLALMRLRTEWDRSAKPIPPTAVAIEQLAASLDKEPATLEDGSGEHVKTVPNPHAGLVRDAVDGRPRYRLPLVVAKEQADRWHEHELKILLQQLKTLPAVRDGLTFWAHEQEIEEGVHLVSAVLLWWLDPTCQTCRGVKLRVVKGTGRTSSKACPACRGTGEGKLPHAGQGRKLLAYLNECKRGARVDLDGKFRHQRRRE